MVLRIFQFAIFTIMATGIILLHWRNSDLIKRQVNEILGWETREIKIYVVDNGGDYQQEVDDDRYMLIRPGENLGFAGGCNSGISQSIKDKMHLCFLLNPDVRINESLFQQLLEYEKSHPDWYAWSPVIKEESMQKKAYHVGGRDPGLYLNSRIDSDSLEISKPEKLDYLPGTALFCRVEMFDKTGLLDDRFFIGGEIADLFFTMKNMDLGFGLCRDIIVVHTREGNTEVRKYLHTYYNFRNRFLLINNYHRKNAGPIKFMWRLMLYRQIIGAIIRFDFKKAKVVHWALRDGLRSKFGKSSRKLL